MKSVLSLLLAAVLVSPVLAQQAKAPAPPDLKKGEAIATSVCIACHAVDGSRGSPANPIIAGQHPEYLVKQLVEFKSGLRPSPIMQGIAASLSEDDMRNVSAFYAGRDAKPGFARNKETVELGASIWRGGIAGKSVPACAGCHSPTGAGIPAQYPGMSGQHAEYTAAQLIAFRAGTRKNSAQMMAIAARLSDAEIQAVSDFASGLR